VNSRHVLFCVIAACLTLGSAPLRAQYLGESREIDFSSAEAAPLRAKADELGSAVRIYEYLRNNAEYTLYHGARSGSVNAFLALRGNEVDLAATLIAMLRYKGVPARYVVGDVRIPADRAMNWLGVSNLDLTVSILRNQGIQNVALAADRSYVTLEHVWVEAHVPFGRYRGVDTGSATNCATEPQKCNWVSLDPSYKQKKYRENLIDIYSASGFPGFDYTGYYNAIKDNNPAYKDKNPLEIYEERILEYLRANHPGKTLDDVAYTGSIVTESNYILPASLPYAIAPGAVLRRYVSVLQHDQAVGSAETWTWNKPVTATATFPDGRFVRVRTDLVSLAIIRFSFNMSPNGSSGIRIQLGNSSISISGLGVFNNIFIGGHLIEGDLKNKAMALNEPYTLEIQVVTTPAAGSSPARTITTTYPDCVVGGFYLIGTGGDSSDWSQVHRAAQQLLAANQQYRIVFNPAEPTCDLASGVNCTPYIDANNNGYDASDQKLIENDTAMSQLTGGLLYVAMSQYFAKVRESLRRLDALNHVTSPIDGFVGVVSSIYEVEYVDGTAFSVLPGGLLIDVKGAALGGNWRIDEPANYANKQFELVGHVASSLEHEIWQELTGYDAVSTVRGIQMALAKGAELVKAAKSASTDTVPAAYPKLGFTVGGAPGFTLNERNIFSTRPASWTHPTTNASFDVMKMSIDPSTPWDRQARATYVYFGPGFGLEGWTKCVDDQENQILGFPPASIVNATFCDGSAHSGPRNTVLAQLESNYLSVIIPNFIGQQFFDYFNENNGFVPAENAFRPNPIPFDAHTSEFVHTMRNELYGAIGSTHWREHVLPSRQACGSSYRISVRIRNIYETASNALVSQSYEIKNNSVAGSNCL
jgi:transglutaminase-like putative cysteine protease